MCEDPACTSSSGVIGLIRKKVSESLVLLAGHQICHESTSHMYYKNMTHFAYINKGNNKITELRTILQRESQNS
jgi:hypothetical protein